MDTQDKRFIAGALGEGASINPNVTGIGGGFAVAHACEWPSAGGLVAGRPTAPGGGQIHSTQVMTEWAAGDMGFRVARTLTP